MFKKINKNQINLLGMNVDVINMSDAVKKIYKLTKKRKGSYICVSTVHMCMEAYNSKNFKEIINSADLVVPDGRPIFWAQRLFGYNDGSQIRGMDLMNELCMFASKKSLSIGLYGGFSNEILLNVINKLKKTYPKIKISYYYSPPFRENLKKENNFIINKINSSCVDILFVGLGCPKQELWMDKNKNQLSCVMLGVGAAFDFIAGEKKYAPKWMQFCGLEWFYRLICEPKRLWKRYLILNTIFIFLFSCQFLKFWLTKKSS